MRSESIEGNFEFDVAIGEAPVQDLGDIDADFTGHLIIIFASICSASTINSFLKAKMISWDQFYLNSRYLRKWIIFKFQKSSNEQRYSRQHLSKVL
jgi:hypothetical protein